MESRLEQVLATINHHRVAVGGLAVAVLLGGATGGFLKPAGLLEEPMAAQLIASRPQEANAALPVVLEPWPATASTANRPWVAGTDYARMEELPRLRASYDEQEYLRAMEETMALPDSTPSATDRAVDAVAEEFFREEPAA